MQNMRNLQNLREPPKAAKAAKPPKQGTPEPGCQTSPKECIKIGMPNVT